MPQSGDADDGRLHWLGGLCTHSPQNALHLLGPAGAMYRRPDWTSLAADYGSWETAWWGLEAAAVDLPRASVARLFRDAGHAVVFREGERGRNYLLVTNSIVGTRGFGNHKHNDQLGFEYFADGRPVVVDPGSYVYTSDPAARNLFRSTAYHSTLMVDGVEQNEINPEWLFRTFEKANAEHLSFNVNDRHVIYRGRHTGYTRLPEPVTHERQFTFDPVTGELTIDDTLSGSGRHRLAWHFHFAPDVTARLERGRATLSTSAGNVTLTWPTWLEAELAEAWYSRSYGARVPCQALNVTVETTVGADTRFRFTFVPGEPT
jgi:hypothetical protein